MINFLELSFSIAQNHVHNYRRANHVEMGAEKYGIMISILSWRRVNRGSCCPIILPSACVISLCCAIVIFLGVLPDKTIVSTSPIFVDE